MTDTPNPSVAADAPAWNPPLRGRVGQLALIVLPLLAVFAVLRAWDLPPFGGRSQSTDNAYIRGRTTVIAPQVSGYVVEVPARDYAFVKAGEVLARIDERSYRARAEQAQANLEAQLAALANNTQAHAARAAALRAQTAALASARAQLLRARADRARADDLAADGSISVRERDQALAGHAQADAAVRQALAAQEIARQDIRTVDVARDGLLAQVAAAHAQLRLAQIDLEHTAVRAPEDGQLGEIGVRLGQYVTNGTQLLALVPAERWVIANFKEAQTARMSAGQPAQLAVDALGGARFAGRVEVLSPAAGSEFSVLKPDNATGNFVKVPQRIGVRIAIDAGQDGFDRLRPGMSVEATVDTRGSAP